MTPQHFYNGENMEPHTLSSLLWFAFGCIVLFFAHRAIAKICDTIVHSGDMDYKSAIQRLEIEKERTKTMQLTRDAWQLRKDQLDKAAIS